MNVIANDEGFAHIEMYIPAYNSWLSKFISYEHGLVEVDRLKTDKWSELEESIQQFYLKDAENIFNEKVRAPSVEVKHELPT